MRRARLIRQIDEHECAQRNALTDKRIGLVLAAGAAVTVIDTLDNGDAFLVEFGTRGPHECDWLGVLMHVKAALPAGEAGDSDLERHAAFAVDHFDHSDFLADAAVGDAADIHTHRLGKGEAGYQQTSGG